MDEVVEKSVNDVCFGCDGVCSDYICSSKWFSRISVDIESNVGDFFCLFCLMSLF